MLTLPHLLPTTSFYKKVLSDLLICRNESFFNFCFEQIFSRKLQASINGEAVSYDQLRMHFLSLRHAYYDAHASSASSSASSSSSSLSTLPHAASAFAPDGSVLKFGPFLANSTNGGREGYLAAHTVLANLINAKWESSPLLSAAQLMSPSDNEQPTSKQNIPSACPSEESSSSSSSSDEPEQEQDIETTPRKRRIRSSIHGAGHHHRIKYNALVVTDTMEIQWMEGKEGECRKITKFERTIRRPSSSSSSSSKITKQRRH